ncbi:MAG TPA: GntR family transcriptional regulator [Gemmataceae bacterium]|nr:GntR family transcriptional regulator [Gemmataceae bacterium]
MWFDIHPDSPIPIFEQIVSQVIFNIAAGGLAVGDLIPSVRDLGPRLTVHPNTVAKAYQELERLGVITARRGRGMEVTPDAPKICQVKRRERVGKRIRETLREAVSSGLSAEEIHRLVEDEIGRGMGKRRE